MIFNRINRKINLKECENADVSEISDIILNQVKQYFHNKSKHLSIIDLHEPTEIHESIEFLSGPQLNSVVSKMIEEDEINAEIIGSLVIFFK